MTRVTVNSVVHKAYSWCVILAMQVNAVGSMRVACAAVSILENPLVVTHITLRGAQDKQPGLGIHTKGAPVESVLAKGDMYG